MPAVVVSHTPLYVVWLQYMVVPFSSTYFQQQKNSHKTHRWFCTKSFEFKEVSSHRYLLVPTVKPWVTWTTVLSLLQLKRERQREWRARPPSEMLWWHSLSCLHPTARASGEKGGKSASHLQQGLPHCLAKPAALSGVRTKERVRERKSAREQKRARA